MSFFSANNREGTLYLLGEQDSQDLAAFQSFDNSLPWSHYRIIHTDPPEKAMLKRKHIMQAPLGALKVARMSFLVFSS